MKRNRHRLSRFVAARIPTMRAVRAWRELLDHWMPDQSDLEELDARPREHRQAVRALMYGIPYGDSRWDVLVALLEWERREERKRREAADMLTRESDCGYCGADHSDGSTCDTYSNVISMDEEHERLRHDNEITVETPTPGVKVLQQHVDNLLDIINETKPVGIDPSERFVAVPTGAPKVFTVRTLKSIREEQERERLHGGK